MGRQANDPVWLSQQSASRVNELDWRLGVVCESKFAPLKPTGAFLIVEAHGTVVDEHRRRIEKAIEKLPPEVQAKVWAAFNADSGISK